MLRKIRSGIDRILLADKSYSFLFERDASGEVISLDCETTGFDTVADDVISIAAIIAACLRMRIQGRVNFVNWQRNGRARE